MSETLYVRLHREANVPGESCSWVLRSRSGSTLRQGDDTIEHMPKASTVVGVVTADMVLIRAVRLPPGRRARSRAALSSAIEPYLLSDPAANHVFVLREETSGPTLLAAAGRSWMDSCVERLRKAGRAPAKLVLESSLVPRSPEAWAVVCRRDGGFLCTASGEVEILDATEAGGIPEVLRLKLRSVEDDARPALLEIHAESGLGTDMARWREMLQMNIMERGAWDWASATGENASGLIKVAPNLLPRVESAGVEGTMLRPWRWPIAIAGAVLIAHVGATTVYWFQRNGERQALQERLRVGFQRAVGPNEPLVDAPIQAGRALDRARRAAGEYAGNDFMSLLGRFAAVSAAAKLPPTALRSLHYTPNGLVFEWTNVPESALSTIESALRAQGMQVDLVRDGTRTRLTLRSSR